MPKNNAVQQVQQQIAAKNPVSLYLSCKLTGYFARWYIKGIGHSVQLNSTQAQLLHSMRSNLLTQAD